MRRTKKHNYNPKSRENLQPFKQGDDPRRNIKGQPKSNLKKLEELIGISFDIALTKQDKFKILESMLETPLDELKHIAESKSSPVFIVNIAMALVKDIQAGRTNTLDSLMDRFFGKARQESVIIGDKESPVFINQESTVIVMPANGRESVQ